jgi:hypothetical protein
MADGVHRDSKLDEGMIPKSGNLFLEKIMLEQTDRAA